MQGICSVTDDCGGIYVSGANNYSTLSNNTIVNSRGALLGKAPSAAFTQAQGIYLDESASFVVVSGNTVTGADNGIQIHVASNNRVENNKLYGNRINQIWVQETRNTVKATGDTFGNQITGNQIVPTSAGATGFLQTTSVQNTDLFAQFDRNRYFDSVNARIGAERSPSFNHEYTLRQWRQATTAGGVSRNQDPNAHATSERSLTSYLVTGGNLIPNGQLANDAKGWKVWNATAPYGTLVREARALGYCARYTGGASAGILSTPKFSVINNQWYRLSADIRSGADNQRVSFVVRRNGGGTNGYEAISNIVSAFTGSTHWTRQTFVFKAIKTVNANDPVTGDLGVSVDFDQVQPSAVLSVTNVELVPTSPPTASMRTDLLLNTGTTAKAVECPTQIVSPGVCAKYLKFSDDSPVMWPLLLPPLGSEIVYSFDPDLIDSDGDGIADSQDHCPATPAGSTVNAAGCSLPMIR